MTVQHAPTPLDDNDPLLTTQEVCELLRINLKTLYRRRQDGTLPGIPVNAKRYLYRRSTIERYLAMAEAGAFKGYTNPPPPPPKSTVRARRGGPKANRGYQPKIEAAK